MAEIRITAEPRTEFGKGPARRVRRADKVPAVLYGHGEAPRHFALPGHELMLALKHDSNVLLTLQTDQGDQLALPRSIVRDPIRGDLKHLDLIAVRRGEKVTVDVSVVLDGETGSDVLVDQQATTISLRASATALPDSLHIDVSSLAVGDQVTAGSIDLPEGAELAQDPDAVVAQGLAVQSEAQLEAELAAAEEETAAGAAGTGTETDGPETEASDVDAGEGTGDIVPETEA